MASSEPTQKEIAALSGALARGRKVDALWKRKGGSLARKYGGQWVAFRDGEVVAASHNPDVLRRKMEARGDEAKEWVIRYVPRSTERFVL
jgi:uncharacterized protein DUF5678